MVFAVRFGDLNLLISSQITNQSRLMFDRGVQARVAKAAPFLNLDADPYPVLVNGHIDWVQDAYTTTDNYPYSQNADTGAVVQGSGLGGNFNYVRNSVKVVIDAYTGKMTFYVMDPNDPIIQTYEKAFPGMFTPASKMSRRPACPPALPRGPLHGAGDDVRQVPHRQGASFYSAADAWTLSPDPGSGSPDEAAATTETVNAQGQVVSTGQLVRMAPIYQVMRIPGENQQSFNAIDAFVPVSTGSQIQTLSGFMVAGSDPGHYGQLSMFVTPRDNPVNGPAIVAAKISATPAVSGQISLLNPNGSSVVLGNVLMIPVANAILYVQPVYVQSTRNAFPVLQRVIAVYGNQPAAIGNTLSAALTQLFRAPVQASADDGRHVDVAVAPGPGAPGPGAAGLHPVPGRPEGREPRRLPDRHQQHGVVPPAGPGADGGSGGLDHHDDDHQPEPGGHRRPRDLTPDSSSRLVGVRPTGRTTTSVPAGRHLGRGGILTLHDAGWSSLVARRAHNPKVGGSNPPPATSRCSRKRHRSVIGSPGSLAPGPGSRDFPRPGPRSRRSAVPGWTDRVLRTRRSARPEESGWRR